VLRDPPVMHARARFGTTWYEASAREPAPNAASALPASADVVVVGGGLCGLATVHGLQARGVRDVVLLEAGRIGSGASGRNGGFCSQGFPLGLDAIERIAGPAVTDRLVALTRDAVALVRQRIDAARIDCRPVDGVLEASWFERATELEAFVRACNRRHGTRLELIPREELRRLYDTRRYTDGVLDPEGLHLHPLDLCRGLARAAIAAGATLVESCPVTGLTRGEGLWTVRTERGEIRASQVVLAISASDLAPDRRARHPVLPVTTYILVTEPLGERLHAIVRRNWAVWDDRFATGYWRPLDDGRLLWGGRIGLLDEPPGLERTLRRDLAKVFPQLAAVGADFVWSGRMGFSRHKMPLVGPLEPGLWLASAFGGHGLGTTTMAGELVAAAIAQGDTDWRLLEPFGRPWVGGPLGLLAAQILYRWMALKDAWRLRRDRWAAARP
jgi:gamma-glutamylputrescine oxidase